MLLRILSSLSTATSVSAFSGSTIFVDQSGVRVEASHPPIVRVKSDMGEVLVFGMVVGVRNADGVLERVSDLSAAVAKLATGGGDWTVRLEGRFIAVTLAREACRISRDRYAKIDVFVQKYDGGVALCTHLSGLPGDLSADGYDQSALAHTLSYYGHRPPKRHTLYKGVTRLGVGETAFLLNGAMRIEEVAFVPASARAYGETDLNDYADRFLAHLEAAGSPDGNVVYLSSGWDSTSILAGLVHVFGKDKVRAVTGRMTYSERSGVCNQFEVERAEKFAEYYGIRLDIAPFDYASNAPKWVEMAQPVFKDNHFFSFTGLNHLILADTTQQTANGREAIFAGEISDGAHNLGFSQYATLFHPSYAFREYADKMASYQFGPTHLQEILAGRNENDAIRAFFRARSETTLYDAPMAGADERTRQLFISFFLRNGRQPFWSLQNQNLLTATGGDVYTSEMADAYLSGTTKARPENLYAWYLHLYNSFHWQGSTVATLPVMAELYGMDAHLPFWDVGVQDWLAAMPEEFGRGLDFKNTKYPLKWMLENRLDYPMDFQTGPHAYTYDVDPKFNHTQEVMCHSSLSKQARDLLKDMPYHAILLADTFQLAYIDEVVARYVRGEEIGGAELNDLVSLYLLCQTGWH